MMMDDDDNNNDDNKYPIVVKGKKDHVQRNCAAAATNATIATQCKFPQWETRKTLWLAPMDALGLWRGFWLMCWERLGHTQGMADVHVMRCCMLAIGDREHSRQVNLLGNHRQLKIHFLELAQTFSLELTCTLGKTCKSWSLTQPLLTCYLMQIMYCIKSKSSS